MEYITITMNDKSLQVVKSKRSSATENPLTIHETIISEMHEKQVSLIKAMTQEKFCVWTHDFNEHEGVFTYSSNSGCGNKSMASEKDVTNGYKKCPFCNREIFINPISCY